MSFVGGVVVWRRQQGIQPNSEGILNQDGNDPVQKRTCHFEAGVGVYLNEPRPEFSVQHEVKPENLKIALLSIAVNIVAVGHNHIGHDGLHLCDQISLNIEIFVGIVHIQISLKLSIRDLIARFIFFVVVILFLDCVVSQMHLLIVNIIWVKFL